MEKWSLERVEPSGAGTSGLPAQRHAVTHPSRGTRDGRPRRLPVGQGAGVHLHGEGADRLGRLAGADALSLDELVARVGQDGQGVALEDLVPTHISLLIGPPLAVPVQVPGGGRGDLYDERRPHRTRRADPRGPP